MKTPEEMAFDYGEKFDGVEISKNDINIAWYEGYETAQEHAHAALEEAEAKIQELQDQLADADKVMPDTCDHILDMGKMVDVHGWISVKDRLPEQDMQILAWSGGLGDIPPFCTGGYELWNWSIKFSPNDCRLTGITHWMPLPEPPKEEK
jgi:hypothetical protein